MSKYPYNQPPNQLKLNKHQSHAVDEIMYKMHHHVVYIHKIHHSPTNAH